MKKENSINKVFGRLTAIKRYKIDGRFYYQCVCSCVNKTLVNIRADSLTKSAGTKSCGCLQKEAARKQGLANYKHGASKTNSKQGQTQLDYVIWRKMKERCYNKNAHNYEYYGKQGTIVYKKWKRDFICFAAYIRTLPNCPSEELLVSRLFGKRIPLSIDRIDNKGNYVPGNLRWATQKEQTNNTARNIFVTVQDELMTLSQAVDKYSVVTYHTVYTRLNKLGWSLDKSLVTPRQDKIKRLVRFKRKQNNDS